LGISQGRLRVGANKNVRLKTKIKREIEGEKGGGWENEQKKGRKRES